MAITRTQQARQMLKKGSEPVVQGGVDNYLGKQPQVVVPRKWQSGPNKPPTELAYITEAEKKLLLKEDIHGSLKEGPNEGPGGVMSLDSFGDAGGGGFSGEDVSAAERGERPAGMSQQQADEFRGGAIAAGAGGRDDDTAGAKREAEKIQRQVEKRRREANRAITKEERIEAKKNRKRMQALKKRDLLARQQRIKDILSGKIDYLSPTERADLEALGLDPAFEGPLSPDQQIAFDNLIEKSDKLSGVNLETFQNRFDLPKTGITSLDLVLNALQGPLKAGAKKNREFFSDPDYMSLFGNKKPSVLEAGKFTYEGLPIDPTVFGRLGTAEMEEIYGNYMDKRMGGEIDAYGNPIVQRDDSGPSDPCLGPNPPAYCFIGNKADETQEAAVTRNLGGATARIGGSLFNFDNMADGGIAGMDREAFLLGGIAKGLKKAVRGVKKLAKSPIGKAALFAAGAGMAGFGPAKGLFSSGKGLGFKNFFRDAIFGKAIGVDSPAAGNAIVRSGGLLNLIKDNPMTSIFLTSALAGAMTPKEEDNNQELAKYLAQNQLEPSQSVRGMGSEFGFYGEQFVADGGRIGYQEGSKEPVAKKTLPLLDMDGMEKDYRETGGFVDMGRMEKADDVPARLSKNEFVFTADAVRNAGEGDIDKGAEVMYNMMKNLEAGGEVSEESQGLEGAREMFQTSQRLGEVI